MAAKVKICGLTRPADAEHAAATGASYLGVVLAGGPRRVSFARAADVVAASRGVPVLGVFGDQPVEEILALASRIRLAGAQLHGAYSPDDAARLEAGGLIVWRVVRIASPADLDRLEEATRHAETVLIEPRVAHVEGGSGVPLDLAIAVEARHRLAGARVALAGGLTPETVAAAVALVRPDVVDVSSGVEFLPGIKDHQKIGRFLEAVLGRSPTVS
ncbi:MAG: phosphoribosylanthranilate isomerase [Gemmatimonadales bacterium]|nr:phosphoribosylanthranilate isomerase [Gemmatimonadales bacterium]